MNYYNEYDPAAAQWLRNLIAAGHLPAGDVDERSIEDVRPADLTGYVQCHFFAGIAGWPLALALAGWPDDRPVWTGSCPCQPFSAAGSGSGFDDERHLWPAWQHLIRQCRPAVIFGEQVASPAALSWLNLVSADLENAGYAVGAADLCAASVGAPHIRQRLYWVADTDSERRAWKRLLLRAEEGGRHESKVLEAAGGGSAGGNGRSSSTTHGGWTDADWLRCRDGKWRPVEPGAFPLADGIPGRMVRLRAYGNAIVPQVAAEFVRAYLECSSVQRL